MPTLRRSRAIVLRSAWLMSIPATVRVPSTTGSRPTAARPIVVLPEPDSPTRPTTSPG